MPGFVACAASLWLTRAPGPGLTPDGMSYLGAAESWSHGRGLRIPYASWSDADSTSPLRAFPPGFPFAIGTTILMGATPLQGARLVVALSAATAAIALAILLRALGGVPAATLGTTCYLLVPAVVLDHVAVLSEPLFLACLLVALLLLVLKPASPLLFGCVAAAASSVRYAGLAVAAGGALWILTRPAEPPARLRRALVALLPTLLCLLAWTIRTRLVARALPVRVVAPAFDLPAALAEATSSLGNSLAPGLGDSALWIPASIVMLLLAGTAVIAYVRRSEGIARSLAGVVGAVAICYLGVVLGAKALVGHDIPLDERILSPLIVCGVLLVAAAVAAGWRRWGTPLRGLAGAAVLAWLVGATASARELLLDIRANGYDYAGNSWRSSETLAWLGTHGTALALYGNHPVPIFYYLHRPSRGVPESLASDSVAALRTVFAARPSALVAFADTSWQPGASAQALAARLGLREAARLKDGTVWVGGAR